MSHIMTVLGPKDPAEVGMTACHEHLFAQSTSNRFDPDTKLSEVDTALEELLAFRHAGGDAIVEVTTIDMGREINHLVDLSSLTGIDIIAATGFYKGNYSPDGEKPLQKWDFLPQAFSRADARQLAELFIQEVCQGVDGTDVKVGIVGEIGTSYNNILEDEELVFKAAARANRETGVPISTHTTLGTMGREQVEILKKEGADLSHVVLSHMDLSSDTAYHVDLARQGVFLGFDTAGKQKYQSDTTRVALIRELVKKGFEDQIVLSCDIGRRSQMRRHGGRGYVYLFNTYIPELEAAGIGRATLQKFLIDNPRRLLAF